MPQSARARSQSSVPTAEGHIREKCSACACLCECVEAAAGSGVQMADSKSLDPLQVDFPVFASGWSPSARSVVLGGGGGPGNSGVKNKLVRCRLCHLFSMRAAARLELFARKLRW